MNSKLSVDIKKIFESLKDVQEKERSFNEVCGIKTELFTSIKNNLESIIYDSFGLEYEAWNDEITELLSERDIERSMEYYAELGKITSDYKTGKIDIHEYNDKRREIQS